MHADLLHPDFMLEDFKVYQRERWREAEWQRLVRQAQPDTPRRARRRLRARKAAIASRPTEHAQAHSAGAPQRILVPFVTGARQPTRR